MKKHVKNNRLQKPKKLVKPDKTKKVSKIRKYQLKRIRNHEDEAPLLPIPIVSAKKRLFYETETFDNFQKLFWKIILGSPVSVPMLQHILSWLKHML